MTEPVQIGDWCTLYHADSVEIVDMLREHAPDAVIMDPPYGINYVATGGLADHGKHGRVNYSAPLVGDIDGPEIAGWLSFQEVILWGADHLRAELPKTGRFLAWDKLGGVPAFNQFCDVEFAWHSRGGAARLISHLWKGIATDQRGEAGGNRRYHPMQKPIRVMEWCIEQCRLEPGALILDPYMGSGTTAIAAFKRKMKFVGCEIDRRWFDVAVERINRQTGDGPLFAEPELPKAEQQSLLTPNADDAIATA